MAYFMSTCRIFGITARSAIAQAISSPRGTALRIILPQTAQAPLSLNQAFRSSSTMASASSDKPLEVLLVGLGSIGSVYAHILERVSPKLKHLSVLSLTKIDRQSQSHCCRSVKLRPIHWRGSHARYPAARRYRRVETLQRSVSISVSSARQNVLTN
jgi:hypothetical protein